MNDLMIKTSLLPEQTNKNDLDRFLFFQEALDLFTRKKAGHLIHRCYTGEGLDHWAEFMKSPDYYVTRSEVELVKTNSENLRETFSSPNTKNIAAIELGPGSVSAVERKSVPFLESIDNLSTYCPVEWSEDSLVGAVNTVNKKIPNLRIIPSLADFNNTPLPEISVDKKVMFEFGVTFSNIPGHFDQPIPFLTIQNYLSFYRSQLDKGDFFVVTYDSNQDEESLVRAYSDTNCEKWAQSLFKRMKAELPISADFDPDSFSFRSIWNPENHLLSHNLIARESGQFQIGRDTILFEKGDKFGITNSYKYPIELFTKMATASGFLSEIYYKDENTKMVLHILRAE